MIESEQSEEVLSARKDSYKFSTPSTAEEFNSYLSKLRPCASELERILGESEKDIKNAKDEREASPEIAIKLIAEVNRISTDLADLTVESNNERWKDSEKDSVKDLLRICQYHGHRIRRFSTERVDRIYDMTERVDRIYDMIGSPPLRGLRSTLQFIFDFLDSEIQRCETERSGIFAAESHIKRYTSSNNLSYITKHPVEKDKDMEFVLIRKLESISIEDATPFLENSLTASSCCSIHAGLLIFNTAR
ncbi:hypothetical protein HC928_16410 [bacterium]|nr:hypothetical protein [bacterium]